MGDKKIHKGFMFSAELDDVSKAVSSHEKGKYKVNHKINMEEYMTDKQHKKFMKHMKICCDISRSAYIKWVEELIEDNKK